MVAQGPDLPIHLGSMPDAVRAVVAAFGADVHDGDVFIHNDPYFGGSHLPDVNVVRPAFYDGRLLGYTCLRAHWPDVGSATPGSYGAVTEIYGEGLRLPPLRLVIQGRAQRRPREGDPRQRAHARRAQGRPRRPARRHPARHRAAARRWPSATAPSGSIAYMAEVMDYSERLMRATLADLPDGEGYFEDFCDGDGIPDTPDGKDAPFWIRMHVSKTGDRLVGRLRRQRPAGQRPHQRAAVGHLLGRVLRPQDGGRPQQPDPAQLRLLAHHRGEGAQGLGRQCRVSRRPSSTPTTRSRIASPTW